MPSTYLLKKNQHHKTKVHAWLFSIISLSTRRLSIKKLKLLYEFFSLILLFAPHSFQSRQTLPRSSTTSRNGAGMLPRPLSDPPKSLQNPSKIEDSWHESFLGGEKQRFMAWIFFFWRKKTPLESPERVSPAKIPPKTLPKSMNFGINFRPSNQLCRKCGFWKNSDFPEEKPWFSRFRASKTLQKLANIHQKSMTNPKKCKNTKIHAWIFSMTGKWAILKPT